MFAEIGHNLVGSGLTPNVPDVLGCSPNGEASVANLPVVVDSIVEALPSLPKS